MEYSTADYLTGIGQKSFIAELMPQHPVYVNLLPPTARDAIGAVHVDTQPARAMLEQEGFRYEGYVDIFDAGPTLECFRDNIHAVRQSQVLPVQLGDEDPVPDNLADDILWLVVQPALCRLSRDRRRGAGAHGSDAVAPVCGRGARRRRRGHRARGPAFAARSMSAEPRALNVNFDGIPGPTHNYAGLAHGNLAAERNAQLGRESTRGRAAGPAQDAHARSLGLPQAVLPPHERPALRALRALGFARHRRDGRSSTPRARRRGCSPRARRRRRCGWRTRRR